MARRRTKFEPVCHWCKAPVQADVPFRTPFEGVQPLGSVGWVICAPTCPDRPDGTSVFERHYQGVPAR